MTPIATPRPSRGPRTPPGADVVERPFGQLAAPFHPGVELFDCITIETPLFGSHTRHAVGVALKYSRGPRPAYSATLTLGGA